MESNNLTPDHITANALHEIETNQTHMSVNKTIVEYDIVSNKTASNETTKKGLISLVNLKISEGWVPLGGLAHSLDGYWTQAMVKYDS